MSRIKDLAGERFGRLLVKKLARVYRGRAEWKWGCLCGKVCTVKSAHLLSGGTKSCGCLQKESIQQNGRRNGGRIRGRRNNLFKHGLSSTRTYTSWLAMRRRCTDAKHPNFKNYGGRGIKICVRWKKSFVAFVADMGLRPQGKTIDRWPNADGNSTPSNCRWATTREQAAN